MKYSICESFEVTFELFHKRVWLLVLILTVGQSLLGQTTPPYTSTFPGIQNPAFSYTIPESVGISSEKLRMLSEDVQEWVANGDLVGGELLIIKDGKSVLHEAYGWADRESGRPVKRNSIWSIKSMSKPFTTTALMMLVEEGKVSLNDKLIKYIPEYIGDPNTTLAHLVSHTTGYRKYDYHDPDDSHKSLKDWVLDWATTKPTGTFGSYEYTDFGFATAGYIVELVTGMSIEEFTTTRIIKPLGLTDTSTGFSDDPQWRARLNAWYRWDHEFKRFNLRWSTNRGPWGIYPAAWGMFSTAMDYAEFISLFLNKGSWKGIQLLDEETTQDMLKPHGFANKSPRYGYGWFVSAGEGGHGSPIRFGHSGGDGTMGYAYPKDNMIVIFMTHSRDGGHLNSLLDRINLLGLSSMPIGRGMVPIANFNKAINNADQVSLDDYTGYYLGAASEDPTDEVLIHIEKESDHLIIRFNTLGQETGIVRHLLFLANDQFAPGVYENGSPTWGNPAVEVLFQREEDEVKRLEVMVEGNQNIWGTKIPKEIIEMKLSALRNRIFVDNLIDSCIRTKGIDSAKVLSEKLHRELPDTIVFGESMLNLLGYRYGIDDNMEVAIAIFQMNIDAYPNSPNCYDSMADAWRRRGDLKKARDYYQEAVAVAKRVDDPRLENIQKRLRKIQELINSRE